MSDKVRAELIKTSPEIIYLQISEDADSFNKPFPHGEENITWCADSVLDCEIKYIRSDIAESMQADLTAANMRISELEGLSLFNNPLQELAAHPLYSRRQLEARVKDFEEAVSVAVEQLKLKNFVYRCDGFVY